MLKSILKKIKILGCKDIDKILIPNKKAIISWICRLMMILSFKTKNSAIINKSLKYLTQYKFKIMILTQRMCVMKILKKNSYLLTEKNKSLKILNIVCLEKYKKIFQKSQNMANSIRSRKI